MARRCPPAFVVCLSIAHTRAELHISSCSHLGPHLPPRTHTGPHMPQRDTHVHSHTGPLVSIHMCIRTCVSMCVYIETHVYIGHTLWDIHLRVGKGVRIKAQSPTLASSLYPPSSDHCWKVRTGLGGVETDGYRLKRQR